MKVKLSTRTTIIIIVLLIAGFFLIMFGLTGIRTAIGILVMTLPFYLILRKWFSREESVFFSFFVGIGLYASVVYYLAVFTGMRIAIVIVFLVLLAIPYLIPKQKKKVEIPVLQ